MTCVFEVLKMKVIVKKKQNFQELAISTEFIKLQDAMKFANIVYSGGEAKTLIQEGQVLVNGEDLHNTVKNVRIVAVEGESLIGEIVEE